MLNPASRAWLDVLTDQFKFFANQYFMAVMECSFLGACAVLLIAFDRLVHLDDATGVNRLSLRALELLFAGSTLFNVVYFKWVHSRTIMQCLATTDRQSRSHPLDSGEPENSQVTSRQKGLERAANLSQMAKLEPIKLLGSAIQPEPDTPAAGADLLFFKRYNPDRNQSGMQRVDLLKQ